MLSNSIITLPMSKGPVPDEVSWAHDPRHNATDLTGSGLAGDKLARRWRRSGCVTRRVAWHVTRRVVFDGHLVTQPPERYALDSLGFTRPSRRCPNPSIGLEVGST
jgi:hypothetical protein